MSNCRVFFPAILTLAALPAPSQIQPTRIETGGAKLLHSARVDYPREALEKRIEGMVTLEVDINESGLVADVRALSGPLELRRAALQSVLQWHFAKDTPLPARRQVGIDFHLPPVARQTRPAGQPAPAAPGISLATRDPVEQYVQQLPDLVIRQIQIEGLADDAREALRGRLPVREGDVLTRDALSRIRQVATEFDEHLTVSYEKAAADGANLRIGLPAALAPPQVRVGQKVQEAMVLRRVDPVYPPLAMQARVSGVVRLSATIGKDGAVKQLQVESGHPLLIPAALEAVKNWVYKPTLLNGDPVEVVTQIEVSFSLAQ